MEEKTTESSSSAPEVKKSGRAFGKLSAIIIILLFVAVLIGGGYILGTRNSNQPVVQTTTTVLVSPSPTSGGVSPSTTPTPVPSKTVNAGAKIGVFYPYSIQIPDGWVTAHSGDEVNIDKLLITKGNYSITIQQASGDAGSCVYPGDSAQPMSQSFTTYVNFQSPTTDFRRSGDNQGQLWTICEKKPAGFQFPTTFGYISYTSSGVLDSSIFTQMDSMVSSIIKQ
jgi:hypothetical protein